jgi:hypothetical protein
LITLEDKIESNTVMKEAQESYLPNILLRLENVTETVKFLNQQIEKSELKIEKLSSLYDEAQETANSNIILTNYYKELSIQIQIQLCNTINFENCKETNLSTQLTQQCKRCSSGDIANIDIF